MKEFEPYLLTIGIRSKAFLGRVKSIYETCCEMCPEKLEDIFVTNYTKGDGMMEYENLWFFSAGYCLEAKQFLRKYDVDITSIEKRIYYWTITMDDYNFRKATAKSKLSLQFHLIQGIDAAFKSEGKNCDFLKNIITKYVKPNLIT